MNEIKTKKIFAAIILSVIITAYIFHPLMVRGDEKKQLSCYSNKNEDISKFKNELSRNYDTSCILSTPMFLNDINPEKTLLIIVGVEKDYNEYEIGEIKSFVRSGGRIIVADDYGFGNTIAKALSTEKCSVDFSEKMLLTENFNLNKSFPVVNAELKNSSYSILTNEPTGLIVNGSFIMLASSENNSYLDLNENGAVDIGESFSVPVVVEVIVGEGVAVFISDPGIFTNEIWDMNGFDNTEFITALISYLLPEGGTIIIDESRHASEEHLENVYQTISIFIILTTNNNLTVLTLLVTSIFLLILIFRVKGKSDWGHKFNLNYYTARVLDTGRNLDKIRQIILDTVKINNNLSDEEFNTMEQKRLYSLINNKILGNFILSKRAYTEKEIASILESVKEWRKWKKQ